jgi:iron complex transport system substrate-binding protein
MYRPVTQLSVSRFRGRVTGCLLFGFMSLALLLPVATAAKPQRVVSLNLCTDQLVLMLAERENIAATSILSRQRENSYMADAADRVPVVAGRIEAVLALQPDLVLLSRFQSPLLRRAIGERGVAMVTVTLPTDVGGITALIRQVADALGESARGDVMIEELQQTLAVLRAEQRRHQATVAIFHPNGHTLGRGTYEHALLELAGYRNLAGELGISGVGALSLEEVVFHRPAALIYSHFGAAGNSRAEHLLQHPALQGDDTMTLVEVPSPLWSCPGPMAVEAVRHLRRRIP